ncbi:MAG: YitT family protein [Muribaculaceae bacterium]|nr:YitT family protein [Muribaculaceae bacterium]
MRTTRDYVFIIFGTALYAFGFCGFILPEKVVIGGVAGVGTIVYFTLGVPVAVTQYVLNLVLLAIAYKVVGKRFVLGTIFGCTMMSFFVAIFQPLLSQGFMNEPVMNVLIGGICAGFGVGLTFTHNGSTGGTDIVAAMVSKHTNVSMGRTMLYVDVTIISSSFLIFHKVETVVYGFAVLFLTSYVVDMIINTNRQAVQFTIFSKKWEEIATAINNDAKRGCTILSGMGWYSKKEVKMLIVMCRKIESVNISRIIKSIDPDAFTTQANVNGVYGQGFDELKVKMKLPHHSEESAAETESASLSRATHGETV